MIGSNRLIAFNSTNAVDFRSMPVLVHSTSSISDSICCCGPSNNLSYQPVSPVSQPSLYHAWPLRPSSEQKPWQENEMKISLIEAIRPWPPNGKLTEFKVGLKPRNTSGGIVARLNRITRWMYVPCTPTNRAVSNAQNITMYAVGEKMLFVQWSKKSAPYWCCIIVCMPKMTQFHSETMCNGMPLWINVAR